jgi:hypothetical protein
VAADASEAGAAKSPHAVEEPPQAPGSTIESPPRPTRARQLRLGLKGRGKGKAGSKSKGKGAAKKPATMRPRRPEAASSFAPAQHIEVIDLERPPVRLQSIAKAAAKGHSSSVSAALGAKAEAKTAKGRARAPAPPKADREARRASNPYGTSQLPLARAKRLIKQIAFLLRHGLWQDADAARHLRMVAPCLDCGLGRGRRN